MFAGNLLYDLAENAQQIIYDIASQRVQASATPGANGRVHGTIGAGSRGPCIPTTAHP